MLLHLKIVSSGQTLIRNRNSYENMSKDYELKIFSNFCSVCALNIDLSTVQQPDPPEPDIRRSDVSGNSYAFELVEVIDENLMRMQGSGNSLCSFIKSALDRHSQKAFVGIDFRHGLTENQKRNLVQYIVRLVEARPYGDGRLFDVPLSSILADKLNFIRVRKDSSMPEPVVCITGATSTYDPLHERLNDKFLHKKYSTDADRIELLVYYDEFQAFFDWAGTHQQIADFIRQMRPASAFHRVWILDANAPKILLVC